MINLICFPHYTCGALLCDILSDTYSPMLDNGAIASINHRIGKIGDSIIFDDYDPDEFLLNLKQIKLNKGTWIGTHCWPGIIDVSQFEQLVVITTTTYRSKLYRWARAYHHFHKNSPSFMKVSGMDRIDKERETAKNYIKPFLPVNAVNVINIEFAEIVENNIQFQNLVRGHNTDMHISRWKSVNNFLYSQEIWNSIPAKRLYEAELEYNLEQYYIYT